MDVAEIFAVMNWILFGGVVAVGLLHMFFDIGDLLRRSRFLRLWTISSVVFAISALIIITILRS
jgi:hypothetical protein